MLRHYFLMAFIRTKKIGNGRYRYLVENHRINGKVRQKVLKYLGAGGSSGFGSGANLPPVEQPAKEDTSFQDFEQVFFKEIDYSKSKKEFDYTFVDGSLERHTGGSERVNTHDIISEFKAKDVRSIHNHPFENPPSSNDIFSFLYSGNTQRMSVVLPSGKVYILKRFEKTDRLSFISPERVRAQENAQNIIPSLNHDFRSARIRFNRAYNDFARIEVAKLNIKTKEEMLEKSPEMQDSVLRHLANIYHFEIEVRNVK